MRSRRRKRPIESGTVDSAVSFGGRTYAHVRDGRGRVTFTELCKPARPGDAIAYVPWEVPYTLRYPKW